MNDRRFGSAIRVVRHKRGWRQRDLAERAGVSGATVSRIDRGHIDTLSLATLRRVASAVDVRLDLVARWRAGDYGRHALSSWVDRLATLPGGDRGYVYFNNDHRACAVYNARTFERLITG